MKGVQIEFIKEDMDETVFMFALFKCRKFDKEEIDKRKSHLFPQLRCVKAIPVMSARLESYSINWEQP